VDVSKVAGSFGGGGHVKAAGFELSGDCQAVIEKVINQIKPQL
jgi:phosphoesterase RecJ-like protein